MKINGKIGDEKRQYDINREAAKISALSSGKIDKYEYLTGEEILPFDLRRVIERAKFAYSPLEEALENHKTTTTKKTMKSMERNCFNLALVRKMNIIVKKITKYFQIIFEELSNERMGERKYYTRMKSDINYKAKLGKGFKILTPKQMLQ